MAKRSVAGAVVELPNRVADHGDRDTLTLTASTPLRLDGPHGGWLVQKGHVDLFAVALHDGEPGQMSAVTEFPI